jgi:hypothetical protein
VAVKQELATSRESVSLDEIDALRVRLYDEYGGSIDVRAHGTLTVSDVAEAVGMTTDEVRVHLDRIRAERAIAAATARKRTQIGLTFLALALFVAAYYIFRSTPVLTPMPDAEVNARLEKSKARRERTAAGSVHYPIQATVDLKSSDPPYGFNFTASGRHTVTESKAGRWLGPGTADEAIKRLSAGIEEFLVAAVAAEMDSPKPKQPLLARDIKIGYPIITTDGFLAWMIRTPRSTTRGPDIFVDRKDKSPAQIVAMMRPQIQKVVEQAVQAVQKSQTTDLAIYPDPKSTSLQPPPGFLVDLNGRKQLRGAGQPILLIPMDPVPIGPRFVASVNAMLRQDRGPNLDQLPDDLKLAEEKVPVPPFTTLTVEGPIETWSFEVPTAPSPRFPTAADVLREATRVLAENGKRAADQVRKLNGGASP